MILSEQHFLKNIALRPINFQQSGLPKLVASKKDISLSKTGGQTLDVVNQGETIELIAVELIGKNIEQFGLTLPRFPLVLKKGEKLSIPVAAKAGASAGNQAVVKFETVLGPVHDFSVALNVQ